MAYSPPLLESACWRIHDTSLLFTEEQCNLSSDRLKHRFNGNKKTKTLWGVLSVFVKSGHRLQNSTVFNCRTNSVLSVLCSFYLRCFVLVQSSEEKNNGIRCSEERQCAICCHNKPVCRQLRTIKSLLLITPRNVYLFRYWGILSHRYDRHLALMHTIRLSVGTLASLIQVFPQSL